jgi:hypothetical protein
VLGACVEPKQLDRRPKDGIELAERIEAALKKPTVEVPTAERGEYADTGDTGDEGGGDARSQLRLWRRRIHSR